MSDFTDRIIAQMPDPRARAASRAALAAPERRYRVKEDDARMGLSAGDILICVPYWLDPGEKLTVIRRESDGFDPECNVYRSQVEAVSS